MTRFIDGEKLPCILVETKSDLLDPEEVNNINSLKEFAEKYEYDGFFRISSKTGLNIDISMEHLLFKIIERINALDNDKEKRNSITGRKGTVLSNEKHNNDKNKNSNCCATSFLSK